MGQLDAKALGVFFESGLRAKQQNQAASLEAFARCGGGLWILRIWQGYLASGWLGVGFGGGFEGSAVRVEDQGSFLFPVEAACTTRSLSDELRQQNSLRSSPAGLPRGPNPAWYFRAL